MGMSQYMKIILMYDLPMSSGEMTRDYQHFHKNIVKRGYIMLQYSLYYKTINAITKYQYEYKHLLKIIPARGNIRSFVITERQFHDMKLLRGNKNINETINNGERYIKIDENLWQGN